MVVLCIIHTYAPEWAGYAGEVRMSKTNAAQGFTDEEARWVKEQLIAGAHPTALARVYGVSAETIKRIRRGETYNHVRVEGEEALRPVIVPVDMSTAPQRVQSRMNVPIRGMSEEEIAESAARVMGLAPKVPVKGFQGLDTTEMSEELRAQARIFGADV